MRAGAYRAHDVRPLIDGEELFESIHADLIRARSCIYITVWELETAFVLHRANGLDDLSLAQFCRDALAAHPDLHIYLLLWEPPRKSLGGLLVTGWLRCDPRSFCDPAHRGRLHVAWQRHPAAFNVFASHHQKFVVCDLDGIDAAVHCFGHNMTNEARDSIDHRDERPKPPYHDTGIRMRGPDVARFSEEFTRRWRDTTGTTPLPMADSPAREESSTLAAALIKREYETPNAIGEWYRSRIAAAQRFIYIENQYFDHPATVTALIEAWRRTSLPIAIVLPHVQAIDPKIMGWSLRRSVRELRRATNDAIRFYTLANAPERWLQMHTKLAIIDDEYTIGSCNIATQSFVTDSEANVAVASAMATAELMARLFAPMLGRRLAGDASAEEWIEALDVAARAETPSGLIRIFPYRGR